MSINPETIGLRTAQTDRQGLSRAKSADRWQYFDAKGDVLDLSRSQWIADLAIPPAWSDVWIAPHENAHILAFGYDEKGRRQYIYHPMFRDAAEREKFERLPDFARGLPRLRADVSRILSESDDLSVLAVAATVRLIDGAGLRIGNKRFRERSGTKGATTLTDKNVNIDGEHIHLNYVAKGGQHRRIDMQDAVLAPILSDLKSADGKDIFSGEDFHAESSDVNVYVQSIMGAHASAKSFRTWGGSVAALDAIVKNDAQSIKAVANAAADYLGNTPTIARNSYIHPNIIDIVKHDKDSPPPAGPTRLYAAERRCFGAITTSN